MTVDDRSTVIQLICGETPNFQPIESVESAFEELQKFNTMTLIYQNGRPIKYAKTPRGTIIMRTILKVLLPTFSQSPLFHHLHLRRRSAGGCRLGYLPNDKSSYILLFEILHNRIAGFRLRILFSASRAIRHNLVQDWPPLALAEQKECHEYAKGYNSCQVLISLSNDTSQDQQGVGINSSSSSHRVSGYRVRLSEYLPIPRLV